MNDTTISPEDKDTISLRVDYEKQYYNSDPIKDGSGQDTPKEHVIKVEKLLNPWASYPQLWNKIFLASCVIGVSIDPLFLYVPIINEDKKCLDVDEPMMYVALVLRIITDFAYLLHLISRLTSALKMAKELGLSIYTGLPWSYLLIDVFAILPLPQVIVLKYFSKIAGSKSLTTRKFLNLLLLLQYVPRILRVYLSAKELGRTYDSLTRRVWVRGAFFFFLYIICGHVFGALWYFYAIFRETACWHRACKSYPGCVPSNFDCRRNPPLKNLTHLNEFCPVDPPDKAVFDFGMFADAIESRILHKTNFLRKFSRSFWWGLRNLSSFGQNLDTSGNVEENLFAVLISILGLLLFLYLIGNLQTYMQLATTKSEEARRRISIKQPEIDSYLSNLPAHKRKVIMRYLRRTIKEDKDFDVKRLFSLLEEHTDHGQHKSETFAEWVTKILDVKKHDRNTSELKAELWISRNRIPHDIKQKIMRYVRLRLQEGKDVDISNLLPILPFALGMSVKKHLCFPMLKKVPMLQNMNDNVYETVCNYLKPVIYKEKSYIIRKGEPLDFILFITQGIVWKFGSDTDVAVERLQKGDYYGKELLEWQLNSTSYCDFPICVANLKCHMKVEGFALMASDLEHVLSKCWSKFSHPNEPMSEGLKPFAAASLQQGFRLFMRHKKANKDDRLQHKYLLIDMH
ncbi:putative cyclic nucleotide-gated ion channel 13 isoform X1 [Morus notabilis]|uniref:putative cyclic nucleotide-gated ion channel 13 isoform X1 n=1 Tax=Morus notabilis TaxID=981085 RepID=UPI000CED6C2F|nr:putative cyclic nucleotide-gated ion channel 13 isoform X1 [Morus notabilis]XP_024020987.1 putative cyclic nucleotide-gated ion channel 13 isoform X1 [Morus notabilis]XP_024020993.1 putative cyclic nucleotide-gated ion channel 13 isoform X1 [Morus notabilis]